ncbi:hypothetical protein FRUB_05020 [Fimbriiglobus ruber]|uniref:Uncharacterized protein n=1 Tax=Fimbriiglobus ruber TaxID=1908690 RepID=A0A225DR83_9BACT|nr:hypothetical protein FRUB_05020 [Fimbriiglobus ruber]
MAQVRGIAVLDPLFGAGWGLQPDPRLALDRTPLADDLFETVESGWASLTGGLIAAVQRLDLDPGVWASVAWDERSGPAEVAGLEEKLAVAVEFGARMFAVAIRQRAAAEDWVAANVPGRITILPVPSTIPVDPWAVLREYLSKFTREPQVPASVEDNDGFQCCRQYYLNLPAFSGHDSRFYRSHLQPFIAGRCRVAIRDRHPAFAATHFVTVVSKSPELAVMLAHATAATNCLLLHTPEGKLAESAEHCRRLLEGRAAGIPTPFSTGAEMGEDIRRAVERFTHGVPPDRVVLDLKSATSKMKYWVARAARPGNWLFNLETTFLDDRRNDPGTERPELWQA